MFAPGIGGTHVANVLSTDPRFVQRASSDDYIIHFKKHAEDAHIRKKTNNSLTPKDNENRIISLHIGRLLWDYKKIKKFKNRKILIVEFPDSKDTLAYKRFVNYNNCDLTDYMFNEQRMFYSQSTIEKFIPGEDFFTIKSESIFNENFEFFYNLTLNLNLKINYDMCKVMHSMWIQKIKEGLKL